MKWSFHIGRLLGIDVRLHVTFLLILAAIAIGQWAEGGSLPGVLGTLAFFLALFGCVLLHEFGHALMARRFGICTHDITLLPIGGVARLARIPEKPTQELAVALAGPAVNVGIAAIMAVWLTVTGTWEPASTLLASSGGFIERLFAVNVFLVLFNMIPAFPMDGGRVLRALLAMRIEHGRATRIAANIGQALACVLAIVGLLSNIFLIFIAVFVWIGAGREATAAEVKSALGGVPVREAMLTDFRTLSPDDTLSEATRLVMAGSQEDFPVVDGSGLVGVLTHERLFEALREHGDSILVAEVMSRSFFTVEPNDRLDTVLARDDGSPAVIPVMSGGHLVGLLTEQNVSERLMIRSALAARNHDTVEVSCRTTARYGASITLHPARTARS